jgi:hypothetical protein
MILRYRRSFALLGIVLFLCGSIWYFFTSEVNQHEVLFSNGSRLFIRRISYSRNNVYFAFAFRRVIAEHPKLESIWKDLCSALPDLKLGRFNLCGSYQSSVAAYLVVWGDAMIKNRQRGFYEFRAIAADGTESNPMDTKTLDNVDGWARLQRKLFPFGVVAHDLPKEPVSVRIYEIDGTTGVRNRLADLPVTAPTK